MKRRYLRVTGGVAAALTTGLLALPAAHAATITQTVNDGGTGWNGALWGPPTAAAPTSGNDYVTASGLDASNPTRLGGNVTGRVRGITGQETFAGDSLEIVSNTELLIKNSGTYTANIILNGGTIRHSPNTAANATLAGTINVAANSVLGSVQFATQAFTISSTVTGSSTLRLAGGTADNQTITFDDGVGTSLNGFSGIFDIGGGQTNAGGANRVTVDFNQAYNMTLAGIVMGNHPTADVLNLDANISVKTFTFSGNGLEIGTYDVATLNTSFGNGSQFTGTGTLTVTGGTDTDSDGLPDVWEHQIISFDPLDEIDGLEDVAGPNDAPITTDFDGDGLSDADEYAGTTSPVDQDSDDDGLNDGPEVAGTDNGGGSHGFGPTEPLVADSDGDAIEDGAEIAGTDNGGVSHGFGPTNPNNFDSDGDDLPDNWEVLSSLSPNSATGDDGRTGDPDTDGLDNFGEFSSLANPGNPDTDGDSLKDGPEVNGTKNNGAVHGFGATNPLDADSDDDAFSDWLELELTSNPNDNGIVPGTAAPMVNGGFESPLVAVSTEAVSVSGGTVPGWTVVANDFYVTDFLPGGLGTGNPGAPSEGNQFATSDRRAPNPDAEATSFVGGTAATMSMRQDIDVSSLAAEIDAGTRSLLLSFDFFDNDLEDEGIVTMRFLDDSNNDLGRKVAYRTPAGFNATWQKGALTGHPPVGTRTVRLTVEAVLVGAGTARNIAIDNMRARLFHLDSDNDDMSDDWELANGLDPTTDDSGSHVDGDTLTNLQEFQHGTDPNADDTDGDTHNDDVEVAAGSDPLDPASIPEVIAPVDIKVLSTNVVTDGSGQVTEVQITFNGLDTNKTYALKRGSDLVTFPDTVDTHQPTSGTEAFTDSSPLPKATSGKAFYILVDAP